MNTKKRSSSRIISSLIRKWGTFSVLTFALVLFPMIAYGVAVDLVWDANTEPDLAGYKIYYGTASGNYSHSVDVGSEEAAAGRNPACGLPYDPFKTECCEYALPLDPGTYYLAAKAYDENGNESAYSAELVHTIAIPQQTGSLQVSITPSGAVSAGAQWRVDGGSWHDSGDTQTGLSVGNHTVSFNTISGWTKPGNKTVTINANQTTNTSGTYTRQTGSLKVTIGPSAAVTAGAQWRVNGGSWRNSGATQSGLSLGSHTVEFKAVSGWTKPGNKTVTINANQTTNTSGTYTRQTGSLKVTIGPSAAVTAGAQWRVDGGSWRNSGATQSGLSLGSHTVEFKAVSGWTKPGNKAATINANQTTNASGTYTQETTDPLISITSPTSDPGHSTSNISLDIAGTASDNVAVTLVSWKNSRGGSGTCSGTSNWSRDDIVLSSGQNVITVTAKDAAGNTGTDTLTVTYTPVDSDSDGVPDDQDAFPNDPDEYLDTDGDGEGNNADTDDDNDGMPDDWELTYGLDPLKDDAADDPDGDGVSNINEYESGTDPNNNEGNFKPYPPELIAPDDDETVSLTPLLETGDFYDPDINDFHSQTQWEIVRAEDEFVVFDVTTESSLTSLTVPRLILEYDSDYIWRVKFIDNRGGASDWSEAGYFTTEFSDEDSDGNGILDHQEVDNTLDLDKDGVPDREQSDIKCVVTEVGEFKICISIREAENAESIVSIQSETSDAEDLFLSDQIGPEFLAFGLIHFKLTVKEPGDTLSLAIYLSKAAYEDGVWYKYNPVNNEWVDYSDFIDISSDRNTVYLTLRDGGFGDADGIENGVIVDPLALRTETDHGSGSDSFAEDVAEKLDPTGMCFISSTDSRFSDKRAPSFWSGIRNRDLSIVFILMMIASIGVEISLRIIRNRKIVLRKSLMEGWRNS